jgi:ADP-ribose pyrophosphatase
MRTNEFKLLKEKSILRSRVFDVRLQRWRGPENSRFERHTIFHPGAVAILPFDEDGNVLMIRQFRPAVNGWLLEIPAGTLEAGERPLNCAKRELIEETGFAANRWQKLGAVFTAPGFCTELIHLFRAWDLKSDFAEKDDDEHIELARMSLTAIKKAVRQNKIRDAKTMSALLCAGVLK